MTINNYHNYQISYLEKNILEESIGNWSLVLMVKYKSSIPLFLLYFIFYQSQLIMCFFSLKNNYDLKWNGEDHIFNLIRGGIFQVSILAFTKI